MVKKFNAIQTTDTSDSIKKDDCDTRIDKIEKIPIHDKYITTHEFNNLAAENIAVRLKQANWATKNDISDFGKNTFWWKM